MVVLDVAVGEHEEVWTAAAMQLPLGRLERLVRESGAVPVLDEFEVETLVLSMAPAEQDRLDEAIALCRLVIGADRPRWACIEAIAMEWLGGNGVWVADGGGAAGDDGRGDGAAPDPRAVRRQISALREAMRVADGVDTAPGTDPVRLDKRIRQLMQARLEFDEEFGRLAAPFFREKLWSLIGFTSQEEYCRERLGMSARTLRQRLWLERQMCALPEIREALRSGRLTLTKALIVAKTATAETVDAEIARIGSTTWQQADRESTESEMRQNRAQGVRRLWGPADAMLTVSLAIRSVQAWVRAATERQICAGDALALMADHFIDVWSGWVKQQKKWWPKSRKEVFERTRGICAWPTCARAAEHDHHIVPRSAGGSDEVWNRVGLCRLHHMVGIHLGFLVLTGRAGERLECRRRDGSGTTWEVIGENDAHIQPSG
jgi:hypothetical protein